MNTIKEKRNFEPLKASHAKLKLSNSAPDSLQSNNDKRKQSMRLALAHFMRFRRFGRAAIGAYFGFITLLLTTLVYETHSLANLGIIFLFLTFLVLLVYATLIQAGFYGALGIGKSGGNPLRIFFMGMPLYILVFLGEEKQMLQELDQRIRTSLLSSL